MKKFLILLMGLSGVLANVIGAFGAHALRDRIDENMLNVFQTGVRYHFYHTLAIALVVIAYTIKPNKLLLISGYGFFLGICLFSGSLYVLATTTLRWIGPLTPVGGLMFMASWLLFMYAMLDK